MKLQKICKWTEWDFTLDCPSKNVVKWRRKTAKVSAYLTSTRSASQLNVTDIKLSCISHELRRVIFTFHTTGGRLNTGKLKQKIEQWGLN